MIGTAIKQYFKSTAKLSLQLHSRSQWQKTLQLPAHLPRKHVYLFSNENNGTKKDQAEKGKQAKGDLPNDNQKQPQITENSSMLEKNLKPQSIQLKKPIQRQLELDKELNRMKQEIIQELRQAVGEKKKQDTQEEQEKKRKEQERTQVQRKAAEERKKKDKQEEQERKKKEEQEAEKSRFLKWWNKHKTDFGIGGGIIAGLAASVLAFHQCFYQYWKAEAIKDEQKTKRQQYIKTKYAKQNLEVQPYYTKKNETEQQLEKLIVEKSYGKAIIIGGEFLFILGTPGMGKTTSIKEIAKNKRQKEEQFFYVNLRDKQIQKAEISPEKVQQLEEAIKLALQIAQTKKTTLVIDDINKLIDLDAKKINQIAQLLCDSARNKKLKILAISSSSKFVNALENNSYLQKEGQFMVLQPKSKNDMEESITKILEYYFPEQKFKKIRTYLKSFQTQAKQYLLEQGHSLRDIIQLNIQVKKYIQGSSENDNTEVDTSKIQSIVSILKQLDEKKKKKLIKDVEKLFQDIEKQPKQSPLFLQILTNYKFPSETIDRQDCTDVWRQIKKIKRIKLKQSQKITDELDKKNILIYCRPRSKFFRDVLTKTIEIMKEAEQITNL